MKRRLLPLIALALMVGACSSNTASLPTKSFAAVSAGTLQTAWGAMPTYHAEGSQFPFALGPRRPVAVPAELRAGDAVVLDVLVTRNGSIRDVKVHASSGADTVDRFFMNHFVGARSLLEVPATDALPYVIRQTFSWAVYHSSTGSGQPHSYGDSKITDTRPMGTGAKHPMDR